MNLHGNEKEFFRLMGLSLPVPELYPHYLEMLSQRDASIIRSVDEFNEYSKWATDMGYSSLQNYRIDHASQAFASWTKANDPLRDIKLEMVQFKEKDHRKAHVHGLPVIQNKGLLGNNIVLEGRHPLFSIDMAEANYSAMKLGAKQKGVKLPHRWSEFCDAILRIHPFLSRSKVFRQHCFGTYNSKGCMAVQKSFMQAMVDKFGLYEQAVFISADEIVMSYENEFSAQLHRDIYNYIEESDYDGAIGVKTTLYEMYRLDAGDDGMLKVSYDVGSMREQNRRLFGVSASKYYMYYRKYILDQPLQENDIIFMNDGMKAKWIV